MTAHISILKKSCLILSTAMLLSAGCGKDESAKPAASGSNAPTVSVSKWQTDNRATSKAAMGLVIEQKDGKMSATLSELKGTNGFVLGDKLAVGSYQTAQKAIILMMGTVPASLMSVEEWVANGGPYVKIPFEPGATNLAMTTIVQNGPSVTVNLVPYKEQ